jgi:hypothetical protein
MAWYAAMSRDDKLFIAATIVIAFLLVVIGLIRYGASS